MSEDQGTPGGHGPEGQRTEGKGPERPEPERQEPERRAPSGGVPGGQPPQGGGSPSDGRLPSPGGPAGPPPGYVPGQGGGPAGQPPAGPPQYPGPSQYPGQPQYPGPQHSGAQYPGQAPPGPAQPYPGGQPYPPGPQPYGPGPGQPPSGIHPPVYSGGMPQLLPEKPAGGGIPGGLGVGCAAIFAAFVLALVLSGVSNNFLVLNIPSVLALVLGVVLMFQDRWRRFGAGILIMVCIFWIVVVGPCTALVSGSVG